MGVDSDIGTMKAYSYSFANTVAATTLRIQAAHAGALKEFSLPCPIGPVKEQNSDINKLPPAHYESIQLLVS